MIEPTKFTACVPADIYFSNLSYPIDETYTLEWDFGDGQFSDQISPSHRYEETGIFDVSLKITSPIGCTTEANYPNWVEVLESPLANFVYSPEKLTNFEKTAVFTNLSENQNRFFGILMAAASLLTSIPRILFRIQACTWYL
ncbi:MAG: PKD domain-containing protein [Saprospiraceae bacterium]|nr:PKD domain-containing protein [Saprospiraceae bacterium]